jgi:hypothetical protein
MLRAIVLAVGAASVSDALQAKDKDALAEVAELCKERCQRLPPVQVPEGTCEVYKNMRPFPLIWRVCEDSYRTGAPHGCELGCSDETICFGLASSTQIVKGRDKGCASYDNMLPRPAMSQSCRTGFTRGAEAFCAESHLWLTEQYNIRAEAASVDRLVVEAQRLERVESNLASRQQRSETSRRTRQANRQQKAQNAQSTTTTAAEDGDKKGNVRGGTGEEQVVEDAPTRSTEDVGAATESTTEGGAGEQ